MLKTKFFKNKIEIVQDYFQNTQFHGLRFLIYPNLHWIERSFWFSVVLASWSLCFVLIMNSYYAFKNNAISFGTDTNYINWNTSLFSVSVCEEKNDQKINDYVEQKYGEDHNFNIDEVYKEIAYFKEGIYFIREFCFNNSNVDLNLKCPTNNYRNISIKVRSSCKETFDRCEWMNKPFNCCQYFLPLESELGLCYTINSDQISGTRFELVSNRHTGLGRLMLRLKTQAKVYIHAPSDVPNLNSQKSESDTIFLYTHKKTAYSVVEILNEPEVKDVDIEQRRCRFESENYLTLYKKYSYSACIVECRSNYQLEMCNCTSHLTPYVVDEKKICNLDGLRCLLGIASIYSVIVAPWSERKGLICDCLPSCTEPEFDQTEQEEFGVQNETDEVGIAELAFSRLPTYKLKRTVVRSRLDLVVSMGGSVGLFVGASLLSFIELFYYCTLRAYFMNKRNAISSNN